MALSNARWMVAALIGILLATVAVLREPVRADNYRPNSVISARAGHAGAQLGRSVERYRILSLRDSVRASLGATPAGTSRAVIAADISPPMRRVIERLLEHVNATRPAAPQVPVDIAFVLDTVRSIRGAQRAGFDGILVGDYVLPRPATGDRCLVLARAKDMGDFGRKHPSVFASMLSGATRMKLLGPCAFYERFGEPGPHIDRWLRDQGWSFGLLSSWAAPYPGWRSQGGWYANLFSGTPFMNWGLRQTISPRGFACTAGDVAACERAILSPPEASRFLRPKTKLWSGIVSTSEGFDIDRDNWWYATARELGPRDWTVLAEMVRTLGPERFGRFWRSSLPPREAFQAAAGEDIGSWTRDWAQRLYGRQARGPGLGGMEAVIAVALSVIALAFALTASARRQVA